MSAETFDWRNPNYDAVYAARSERLARMREHPESLPALKTYYADHIGEFINDWGVTSDPRNRNKGLPVETPFLLFPKQRDLIDFMLARMASREPGIIEKARDAGCSWLAMCTAVSLCLFGEGVVIGVGSAKEDLVDRSGDPDSLLWKARFFLSHLPPEFRGSWDETKHSAHMRINFPETASSIVGAAGDSVGRGGRTTAFILDESAHLPRPQLVDAALASNTDARIDISTPCGRNNSFAARRHSGTIKVFTLRWTDDPRKDSAWYAHQCEVLDPVTRAQEIDLSYDASTEGILCPIEWVNAAIDAHTKLGLEPTGECRAALDIADEGRDRNALCGRRGVVLEYLKSWSGKGSDIYRTVVRAFGICQEQGYSVLDYDADGIGAGARGDAAQLNAKRREAGKPEITAEAFRGSGAVAHPEDSLIEGRLNKDFFANLKAQAWWALRMRFQNTYRAVVEGLPFDPDSIISIDPNLEELNALLSEITQPTYTINGAGKIVVDKVGEGVASPNLADALMIAFSPFHAGAYFAPPPMPTAAERFKVYPLPTMMDDVFAVVSFADDAAAVVYCAANHLPGDGTCGPPFHVLWWDVVELGTDTEKWVRRITHRLEELFVAVSGYHELTGMPHGTKEEYVDDPLGNYTEFLRQLGIAFKSLDKDLQHDQTLPSLAERFAKAKPYVNFGQVVIDRPAHEREVTFRGTKRNFLRELLSQAEVVQSNPLAQAFSTAVLMVFKGAPVVALAESGIAHDGDEEMSALRLPRRPPRRQPPPPPPPHVLLKPGRHVIDGEVVDVPREADKDLVIVPLTPGRHIVDSKITYVSRPEAAGLRFFASE